MAPMAMSATVPPDVQAVGAPPAPIPPAALAPHPDFSLALTAARYESSAARVRMFSIKLRNVAGWTATSVRACVAVTGASAKVTGVKAPGSQKVADSACWQFGTQRARVGHNLVFRIKTKRAISAHTKVRASVKVTAGNANPLARVFRLPVARQHVQAKTRSKRRTSSKRHKAVKRHAVASQVAAASPRQAASCVTGQSLGIAFVADDSGSMSTNDPDELRGQAISVGLDQMPDGSQASATRFDDYTGALLAHDG
jgi:hypothetical protein